MNVLILDDCKELSEAAKFMFEALGCEAHAFDSIGPALRHYVHHPVDMCLVDYRLTANGASGNDFMRKAKEYKKAKMVLMTGSTTDTELKMLDPQWDILLWKPSDFNTEVFHELVQ